MDPRTNMLLADLHPVVASKFASLAAGFSAATGDSLEVVQGLRSWQAQSVLYDQGRTAPGAVVTNAPPGYSWHEFGLALDVCPKSLLRTPGWSPANPLWKVMQQLAQAQGFTCGACWTHPDTPHLQITGRFPVSPDDEVRQLFLCGGIQAVWDEAGITDD
jgi:peptidoglycan L-alanyl-D-glutamate endopeptidase CwlK